MQSPLDRPGVIFIDIYTTQPQHQMKVAEILSQVLVDTSAYMEMVMGAGSLEVSTKA